MDKKVIYNSKKDLERYSNADIRKIAASIDLSPDLTPNEQRWMIAIQLSAKAKMPGLEDIPVDVTSQFITADPFEIINLCKTSKSLYKKYCQNRNSDFWKYLYQDYFNVAPEDPTQVVIKNLKTGAIVPSTYMDVYILAYQIKNNGTPQEKMRRLVQANLQNLLFNQLQHNPDFYETVLREAAKSGNINLVDKLFTFESILPLKYRHKIVMIEAARAGHENIVRNVLVKGGHTSTTLGLVKAAANTGGHTNISDLLTEIIFRGKASQSWAMDLFK